MEPEIALYMVPVAISDGALDMTMPDGNREIVGRIRHFIVENVRTARRFLKRMCPAINIDELTFRELNGHTSENEISGMLDPLRKGEAMAMMSEAGCPGVADPGASVARLAQNEGFKVVPLVGPSSILLSLMASGLNGQRFCFNGYLPVENKERERKIREFEARSRSLNETEIFIETPYRNVKLMEGLLKVLGRSTFLCIASDVTGPGEKIITRRVEDWKRKGFNLEKVPTIFLFYNDENEKKS
ncbi:MAG: SAM-dependent methyltransferase [Muribaculaceae bacterium]|nr:SAM-dependent methyltransferase [Muribaculaceae bacterium]